MTSGCTSSFRPELFPACIRNAATVVKPGGYVLFRDYGLYDHAQLRFKAGCVDGWLASIFFYLPAPRVVSLSRSLSTSGNHEAVTSAGGAEHPGIHGEVGQEQ